jgi:mRNA interferase ChpB
VDRGEIWNVDLEPTIGSEQQGRRPVFIVTKKEFNQLAKLAFVCPVTGGGNLARYKGFAVNLQGATKTDGVILCHQMRAIDLLARKGKRVEQAPDYITEQVLDCLADLIA